MKHNIINSNFSTPRFSVVESNSPFNQLSRCKNMISFSKNIKIPLLASEFPPVQRGIKGDLPFFQTYSISKNNFLGRFPLTNRYKSRIALIILFISLFIFSNNEIISKEFTPYYLDFGAGINLNMYQSDFTELKGFPNCCNSFDNANGLSYYFYAGISKRINLLNDRTKFGINLEVNNFSANYLINEYIGNDIQGDTYRKIYVDNKLNVNWLVAGINPYINLNLFENLPLDFKIGFNLGIPLTKSFTQQEIITEPSDLLFDNGSIINYDYSGDLPDASSIYLGAMIGAKYLVSNVSGFDFSPELSLIYGLSSPVKDYSWNNIAIRAGISITYNIPEKAEERIVAPPTIEPTSPPIPEPPDAPIVTIKVMDNEKIYSNGDTITAIFKIDYYNYLLSYIPVLFFESNQIKPKSSMNIIEENNDMNFFEIIRKTNFADNYGEIVAEYAKKNNLKIEVIGQSPDESFDLVKERLDDIRNKLISYGIDKDNINYEIKKIDKVKDDRQQVINELRNITFKFSDKSDLITSTIVKDKIDYKFNKSLGYIPDVKSEFNKIEFNSYSQFNNGEKNPLGYKMNDILLTASLFENNDNSANELKIYAEAVDSLGQKGAQELKIFLKNRKEVNNKFYNITDNDNSALILGYFNFDSFNFSAIDYNVLNYVKEKIKDNQYFIEIIPSTDNLGTPDYNKNLADKRAKSSLNLLSIRTDKLPANVSISYPEIELFSNETPYGRYLNRTVIIKIRKK